MKKLTYLIPLSIIMMSCCKGASPLMEIAVQDDQVERLVEAITGAAKTGKIGDGKVFVYDLEGAVRIRTGETDTDAL